MTPPDYPHPLTTAADLRRAAELVIQHGFTRQFYVGVGHTLCADGAIRLAVGDIKLVYSMNRGALYDDTDITSMDTLYRRKAALDALSRTVPTDGCASSCNVNHPALNHPEFADIKVYHYNDFICQGGPELAALLIRTAEQIETTHTPTLPLPRISPTDSRHAQEAAS